MTYIINQWPLCFKSPQEISKRRRGANGKKKKKEKRHRVVFAFFETLQSSLSKQQCDSFLLPCNYVPCLAG